MTRSLVLLALCLCTTTLAGCGSKAATVTDATHPALEAGKGAIAGLVIDDRYRPIPDATILLTPLGVTAVSDGVGQFTFLGLEPGTYEARVQAAGHEAAPTSVDVVAGQYVDLELQARRIFSNDGGKIVTEYSVFIDCAVEAVLYSGILTKPTCTGDESGDSARPGFDTDLRADAANVSYIVSEFLFNQKGNYGLVIGLAPGGQYDTYYAEGDVVNDVYKRFLLVPGQQDNRTGEDAGRNVKTDLSQVYQTTVFPHAQLYNEIHQATGPTGICVGGGCVGAGVALGVKAKIIQTVFLGTPQEDIETYALLKPAS